MKKTMIFFIILTGFPILSVHAIEEDGKKKKKAVAEELMTLYKKPSRQAPPWLKDCFKYGAARNAELKRKCDAYSKQNPKSYQKEMCIQQPLMCGGTGIKNPDKTGRIKNKNMAKVRMDSRPAKYRETDRAGKMKEIAPISSRKANTSAIKTGDRSDYKAGKTARHDAGIGRMKKAVSNTRPEVKASTGIQPGTIVKQENRAKIEKGAARNSAAGRIIRPAVK